MIVECTRGFSKVKNPRTDEEIDVEEPFETDRETFEALNDRYPGFEVVSEDADPGGRTDETTEEDADEPECGYNGCSRTVDDPADHCWQHPPDDE